MKKKAPMPAREAAQIGPRQMKDPNSPEFAWQTVALLKVYYQSKEVSEQRWRNVLAEAEQHRIYEKVPEGKPYGSLDAMLLAEIGRTAEQSIKDMANNPEVPPMTTLAEAMKEVAAIKPRAEDGTFEKREEPSGVMNTARTDTVRGSTNAEYLVRRLKRDAAERKAPNHKQAKVALAKLQSGELKSARAAAIAAGIIRVPSVGEVARKAVRKLTDEGRQSLVAWIDAGMPNE